MCTKGLCINCFEYIFVQAFWMALTIVLNEMVPPLITPVSHMTTQTLRLTTTQS